MTRSKTRSYGLVTPPYIQPLLDAALRAFAWLVSNLGSICRTILNRRPRDWHTDATHEGLLRASTDLTQGTISGPPGPRPAVDAQRRTRTLPNHASTPILRDDRRFAPIPQDEARWLGDISLPTDLILRAHEVRVSKDERGSTTATTSPSFPPKRISAKSGKPGATRAVITPQLLGSRSAQLRCSGGHDDQFLRVISARH